MNLFAQELKKIWNWRILALIAAIAALFWFSLLSESVRSYESLNTHGAFGSHQREMFERYGATLEPEELVDYDIPGKKAAILAELDSRIASDTLFAEHGIRDFAGFQNFAETASPDEENGLIDLLMQMDIKLSLNDSNSDGEQSLNEYYESPRVGLQTLRAIEDVYIDYESRLNSYIQHDERPVVVRSAKQILDIRNHSLIRDNLGVEVSTYATVVGIFSIAATLLLVAPPIARDRTRKINLVQYSSSVGRRILLIQWGAMMFSTCILSLALIVLSAIPWIASGVSDYANVSLLSYGSMQMMLYDITFGQYAALLAGLIVLLSVAAACFAFLLARFSTNMMTMLIKTVPVGVALSGLAAIAINMAFSYNNILFNTILRGRFEMPEPILCTLIAAAGILTAVIVALREKKANIA